MASETEPSLQFHNTVSVTTSLATSWYTEALAFSEYVGAVSCLEACPDAPLGASATTTDSEEPCYSANMSRYTEFMEAVVTMTPGQEDDYNSEVARLNDAYYTYVSCLCAKSEWAPWSTAASGVCDSGEYTECKNPTATGDLEYLESVHVAYSSMCGDVVAARAETTEGAAGADSDEDGGDSTGTAGASAGSGTGSDQPGETGAGGDSGVRKTGVSLSAALLAGIMGVCLML
ncbi:hypothetical protein MKZ38_004782 [Zalerion maritima]|uniref:Uncharacterized protein n=1 Tax=Zalerion maritima TaxID=339359 RepID=A0AAD5RKY1_9PEZI|nr:hypothetical protein MKZ38_004782 [Zalerion maritima]